MSDDYNILKVNIYGTEYPIKGSADIDYIKKVAQYVDSKMREVNKNISIDSSLKVSILAALNITDELFRVREVKSDAVSDIETDKKIRKLNLDIETCLENSSS